KRLACLKRIGWLAGWLAVYHTIRK
ncbi:hypothetical protein DOY81_007289, partial [Sarcophaga bullata]